MRAKRTRIKADDSVESAQRMLRIQVGETDANLAGNEAVDARVLKYSQERVREFCDMVLPLHQRWAVTHHMLMGNTIDRAGPVDCHVPELYKILETGIPRLEESILGPDPPFRAKSRQEPNEGKANAIAAMLDAQLDQMKWRRQVQPGLRDMFVNQVCIQKLWWNNQVEERTIRDVEVEQGPDEVTPRYKITVRKEKKTIYNGPVTKLVDPFNFLIDPKATDPQDALFVGDRCYMSYDQLKEFQRQGFLKNVDELKDVKNRGTMFTPEMDYYKWTRSPLERYGYNSEYDQAEAGQPIKFEVVELWGKFDLHGNGEYVEAVITIANGNVILRAMANPYDWKFRPYATARAARNGHDFWGIGPLDNAVRLNQQLDRYHSIFMRAAEIAACPMVFVSEDSEIPDSLYKVRPFSVFRGTGDVKMTNIPDGVLRAAPGVIAMMTRQIEEVTGVFKIQMGQQDITGGTATEANLSLREGNRRMSGLVRSYADMMNQMLQIMHMLNRQFLTDRVAFRVLGKRAKEIGDEYLSLGPDTFMLDVDFEFVGLEALSTYGLRATGLQQIMATAAPLIIQNPDRVNQVGILHALFDALIGPVDADRFVNPPSDRRNRMSQPEENLILLQGVPLHISPDDPHDKHLADMKEILAEVLRPDSKYSAQVKKVSMEHMMEHATAKERQAEEQAVQQQAAQQRQQLLAPEAGGDTAQSPMAGGMQAGAEKPGQTTGQVPGPVSNGGQQYGTMGRRSAGLSQSQDSE